MSAGLLGLASSSCTQEAPAPPAPAATIAGIQNTIARADSSREAYYATHYAPVEPRYWSRIAGWMVEDWIERTVVKQRAVHAILDVGCGYGTLLAYAAGVYGAAGTCFDVVPYLQPAVMQRYGLHFVPGNIEKDALPAGAGYGLVIMTEVLEHLNFQPVPTLKKIRAALSDDGVFFLSTPDADGGWGRTTKYYGALAEIPALDPTAAWIDGHIWQYSQAELEQVLHDAGFEIRRFERSDGVQGRHFNVWAVKRPQG